MKLSTRIRNDFITGIAVLMPLAITIIILNFITRLFNRAFIDPVVRIFGIFSPIIKGPYLRILAKGIILFIILTVILLMGIAARILFLRRFFSFWENMLLKVPMVNKIYTGTKQLSDAFLGEKKTVFSKVVLVEYPRQGIYSIGFLTAEGKRELMDKTGRKLVHLFLPTAPNPTSGMFVAVPKEDVIFLDMSIEDAFKLIISAGAV